MTARVAVGLQFRYVFPRETPANPWISLFSATWRSGDAADCKSVHPGSIPGVASTFLISSQRHKVDCHRQTHNEEDEMAAIGWQGWALMSAVFAALTAILAKVGVEGVDPDIATFIRTLVIA